MMSEKENLGKVHQKIGVVGGSQGMGSWIVKFFEKMGHPVKFTSADQQSQFTTNIELVNYADVIFLAVPIAHMEAALVEIFPYLHQKTLVEVCSVKQFLVDKFLELSQNSPQILIEFLSIHPMFSQSIRQLKGQVILFTHSERDMGFRQQLWDYLAREKAQLYEMDYLQHDQIMGVVQGLNHFNVFASASTLNILGEKLGHIKDYSSPPYRIFLIFFSRYILQDPRLYADIQMYNQFVPETLLIFKKEIDRLYDIILRKDRNAFIEYANTARNYFEENQEDTGISNHLIEQLGIYINKLKSPH